MKRTAALFRCFFFSFSVFYRPAAAASTVMGATAHGNLAVNKFQNGLQQQNFFTILNSIEERLKSLDTIYSMQLSTNLETKLDHYSRKIETLDTKIMRLEALVMLNLDKISENISTKNFKDDVSKTNTYRKMDSLYEGISHRLSYVERKLETHFGEIKEMQEATLSRLDKMESSMTKRDSDLETEISDTIFAIDDLKTTYTDLEGKLFNVSESVFNITSDTYNLLARYNTDMKKSVNRLHDNIIGNLQFMHNRTSHNAKLSEDSNEMLKNMKMELKADFNEYANKVADMNSDIWKNTDTTEDDLKAIAIVVNNTKIDLQNGVRSLMLQIGKISSKENDIPTTIDHYQDMDKKLTTNFEKILTNQDVFLESCHRLQMDESQIENEISAMLNKLIDMLEKRLESESKDARNVEKALKAHDSRINRNLHQANNNIISLFEKSTTNNEFLKTEIGKIDTNLNALFSFVQTTLNDGMTSPHHTVNIQIILDRLDELKNVTKSLKINDISDNIQNIKDHLISFEKIDKTTTTKQNCIAAPVDESNSSATHSQSAVDEEVNKNGIDKNLEKTILDVFGPNPQHTSENTAKSGNCRPNYKNLIDARSWTETNEACGGETVESVDTSQKIIENGLDEDVEQAIIDVFGPEPKSTTTTTTIRSTKKKSKKRRKGKKTKPLIDIRGSMGDDLNTLEADENLEQDFDDDMEDLEENTDANIDDTTTPLSTTVGDVGSNFRISDDVVL